MPNIHPTAVVSSNAEIDTDVKIGPYSVIEDNVIIRSGTVIGPHCVVHPYVKLGENNQLHAQVVLGGVPQDISFNGEETWVEIGDENIIRENCTVHRSTNPDAPTTLGSKCYLMSYSHVAHDCQLGNEVVLTAYVGLSGHIEIGDKAILGGHVGTHQFIRIGKYSMIAGFTPVRKDVLPFCLLGGDPVKHYRLNSIGLRRAGIKGEQYKKLENVYRHLRDGGSIEDQRGTPEIDYLREWMLAPSKRGIYGFLKA
ncbi:MAG: acyl-ACP--UDP-N-acetylglucosamine O-acyltransferase [Gammaproteobacteria bacterium]